MRIKLIATATFGLEAVVRREIEALGYEIIKTEDGKVTFWGDERAIARCNIWLRTADRVLLLMGEFEAFEFEDLFQQVKALHWEQLIPPDGRFTVTGTSVKSKLHSVPACQSVTKKAIASKLGEIYCMDTLPETGAAYNVKVTLLRNRVTLTTDTSGEGLHKRGYRAAAVAAPIKETLAAAMVELSFWDKDRLLADPCCGSGTIAIEAAMIGKNIAPGLSRNFASEGWDIIKPEIWKEERKKAFSAIDNGVRLRISASDNDGRAVAAARKNALEAGVSDDIKFNEADMTGFESDEPGGIIITNPPYGERIGERKQIERIYAKYREFFSEHQDWSLFMITTDKTAEEKVFARPADRRRKLYNGRLEVCYYQFHGKKSKK